MTFKRISHLLILTVLFCGQSQAATRIVTSNQMKHQLNVVIEDNMARFNDASNRQYQLINLSSQKVYDVNFDQGYIIDVSVSAGATQDIEIPKIELKELGQGPDVAGFTTVQYQMYADKKLCETLFLSKKAADNHPSLQKFISVMGQLAKSGRGNIGKAGACRIAQTEIFDSTVKLGTLMKSVSSRGKVTFEILKVENIDTLEEGYFELPKSLEMTTMQGLIEKMRQQYQQ